MTAKSPPSQKIDIDILQAFHSAKAQEKLCEKTGGVALANKINMKSSKGVSYKASKIMDNPISVLVVTNDKGKEAKAYIN